MKDFKKDLDALKHKRRYRSLSLPNGIDLTSNDYLGLANHPALRKAAIEFLQNGGDIGAGGSRLLRGHTKSHAALETFAADFFAVPKTLYFATGFQANTAIFQTLPSRHDTIIFDAYIHASARDGIQNSNAAHIRVPHNDVSAFEAALKKAKAQQKPDSQIWIAVESLYSMDGDIAPLKDLYDLASQYGAILIVDEAHSTGVLGTNGKGLMYDIYAPPLTSTKSSPPQAGGLGGDKEGGSFPQNLITLHTCGKAIGVAGGLVCASETIIDTLINTARPFIYSTAPMPLQAYLVQKSLELIASPEGEDRRQTLARLCEYAQSKLGGEGTHIAPLIIGDDDKAVHIAQSLQQSGYDIRAIRPPTVPENTARLRLSLSANLDEEMLDGFMNEYLAIHSDSV